MNIKDYCFIVVNKRNEVQAMFIRRWQAEKFANEYGFEVKEIKNRVLTKHKHLQTIGK